MMVNLVGIVIHKSIRTLYVYVQTAYSYSAITTYTFVYNYTQMLTLSFTVYSLQCQSTGCICTWPVSGGGEREGEAGEGQEPPSIPELLGLICYYRGPSVVSTITARTLAHDIAVLTVSPLPSCVYIPTRKLGCLLQ